MDLIAGSAGAAPSVFLSSAAEDSEWAEVIGDRLDRLGLDVLRRPRAASSPGAAEEITDAVGGATAFLVLLSDYYLESPSCRAEAAAAIRREEELRAAHPPAAFIYVLQLTKVASERAAALSIYVHLNAAGTADLDATLDELHRRLRLASQTGLPGSASAGARHEPPEFRNRGEELDKVVNGLTDSGGPHFWVVVAPPQLGKSRFLGRVLRELQARGAAPGSAWAQRAVDLRQHPEARSDPGQVLAHMFNRSAPVPDTQPALRALAREIRRAEPSLLCTLDSAELLAPEAVDGLRSRLSKLYKLVVEGRPDVRFGLVIGSRSVEGWRGVAAPRIRDLSLTGFSPEIVSRAIRDFAEECGRPDNPDMLPRCAASVYRLSEGLPGLLTRCLHWIRDEDWLELERLDSQELFEELARPYILEDLLSPHSLFERGAGSGALRPDGPGQPRLALEHAFRVLAPYRFFTLAHLSRCMESDPEFARLVADTRWSVEDLMQAIADTALLEQPLDELWHALHPSIRRLLYRYYFRSDQQRIAAHRAAMDFVRVWSGKLLGSREQVIGLIEALWHEAVVLSLSDPAELERSLTESARKFAGALPNSDSWTASELRKFAVRCMQKDEELQAVTSSVDGLFDRLVGIIGSVPGS